MKESRVTVVGLGYVGCVTAACLAKLGHRVTGVDRDEYKVRSIEHGRAPFFEPGLETIIRETTAAGRFRVSTDIAQGLEEADVALICVGTPSAKNGNLNLEQLQRVASQIGEHLKDSSKELIVAVRSTVFPGTCEEIMARSLDRSPGVTVVANPEFLREGSAVRDFMEPSLVVVGGSDLPAVKRVAGLYAPLGIKPCLVALRTAELIKYACNGFHALKIAFANEIGTLCSHLSVPPAEVMDTLCRDVKLNISPAYLKPGFAFGGSCLPKDLRALAHRAGRLDLTLPLVESVLPSNDEHLRRALDAVLDLAAERIGVFGLAFKQNTDDLRESPVVALLEHLIGKGRDVRVFDPHIQLDQIYGSNERFLFTAIPHISKLLQPSLEQMLDWAEHVVVAQKPSPALLGKIQRSGIPILDLVGVSRPVMP